MQRAANVIKMITKHMIFWCNLPLSLLLCIFNVLVMYLGELNTVSG